MIDPLPFLEKPPTVPTLIDRTNDILRLPTEINTKEFCLSDICHSPIVVEKFLEIIGLLRRLNGRTIKHVELINTLDKYHNPNGEIAHLRITLEP